jgi:hypothetical protein
VNDVPHGTLRVTADPVFGDALVTGLVNDYVKRWPEVHALLAPSGQPHALA